MTEFAAIAIALYAGHHVGDYWVQTDTQAAEKGKEHGRMHCLAHVLSYLATQAACLLAVHLTFTLNITIGQFLWGMLVSGVTHYMADRREFGLMFKLARLLPGKENFLRLGAPRGGHYDDNPSLGTGAWALDQSWHLFWGVFVTALAMAA